ncbi:unnamed protein product [marine sediment metagenome]|uniref:Uncharacterized protein n=1 Tax=marine sediment metagenome TaxID=412755 RepID=X1V9K2_9ZZZZ
MEVQDAAVGGNPIMQRLAFLVSFAGVFALLSLALSGTGRAILKKQRREYNQELDERVRRHNAEVAKHNAEILRDMRQARRERPEREAASPAPQVPIVPISIPLSSLDSKVDSSSHESDEALPKYKEVVDAVHV